MGVRPRPDHAGGAGASDRHRGATAGTAVTDGLAQARGVRLVEVPADDPEAVPDRLLELMPVEPPVGATLDADEAADAWIGRRHHAEQLLDLVEIGDQLRAGEDVAAPQPDALRPALLEVELPVA